MRKVGLFVSLLLLSTMWLPAQEKPAVTSSQNPPTVTVVGCVVGLNGGYTLNADQKHYQLAGSQAFEQFIGQKVRAVGTESYSKKPGTGGKAENMVIRVDSPTLTVSKIEKLADTCSSHP